MEQQIIDPDWLQLAVALIAVVATSIALKTLKVLEKQTNIGQKTAEATKANTDALINIERPWVLFDGITWDRPVFLVSGLTSPIQIHFKLKNFGRTPACITHARFRFIKSETRSIENLSFQPSNDFAHSTLVAPGSSTENVSILLEPTSQLPRSEVEAICAEKLFLFFYGEIQYRDVFEQSRPHHSRFCFRLAFALDNMGGVGISQQDAGPPEANEYT